MTVGFVPPGHGSLPALRLVQSSRNAQRLAKVLMIGLVLSSVAMALLPWQQSVAGQARSWPMFRKSGNRP